MEINFKSEQPEKILTLEDVEENQFFVSNSGELCQRTGSTSYNCIAREGGRPYGYSNDSGENFPIKRVLPKVTKINF